eukprot:gene3221-1539_t
MESIDKEIRGEKLISFDDGDPGSPENFVIANHDTTPEPQDTRSMSLRQQATRDSIADELCIPVNSEVALQAVAEFELSVDYDCPETNDGENVTNETNVPRSSSGQPRKGSVPDEFEMLLASTYVEEAFYGRNGFFIPEKKQLRLYYWYNQSVVRFGLFILIWTNMALVLFEDPAVDGWGLPHWATMSLEMICLIGYFGRLYHAWAFMPKWRHWQDRKVIIVLGCLLATLIDMGLYIILKNTGHDKYAIRWSRVLRPAFMINFSESRQIRRAIRNIRRTLPEISNVLFLLLLIISLYALLGLKLFGRK